MRSTGYITTWGGGGGAFITVWHLDELISEKVELSGTSYIYSNGTRGSPTRASGDIMENSTGLIR